MNIQVLMHASHEGPGAITAWAAARGHVLHMELFVKKDAHELVPGKWIAPPETLLAPDAPFAPANDLLFRLLDRMVEARRS